MCITNHKKQAQPKTTQWAKDISKCCCKNITMCQSHNIIMPILLWFAIAKHLLNSQDNWTPIKMSSPTTTFLNMLLSDVDGQYFLLSKSKRG